MPGEHTFPIPPGAETMTGEALIEARVHERRGTVRVRLLSGTGDVALDQAALQVVRGTRFHVAGEMGVGVPSWLRVRAVFDGEVGRLSAEESPDAFWRR
jgi:TonB family protein